MSFKIINHLGSFLFLAAFVFLVVTSVSAPVANSLGLMTVNLADDDNGDSIVFGSFGYCVINGGSHGSDLCTKRSIGYSPAKIIEDLTSVDFGSYEKSTSKALTNVMVLHPVAAALSFITFLISLSAHTVIGSLVSSLLGLTTFLITGIALICDFVLFAIVRRNVNDDSHNDNAYFSAAIWTALIAEICLLFGSIIIFFACCTNRRSKRRASVKAEFTPVTPAGGVPAKKKFWQRK